MRVSREEAAQNRERVLDTAARLFRERGFSGIGLADLMKDAGLTHGGFYGQFSSKDDLIAQACGRALGGSLEYWQRAVGRSGNEALAAITRQYLSPRHRDSPGAGCIFAALGPDVSRQGPSVRRACTNGLQAMVGMIEKLLPGNSAARRRRALAAYSCFVGAMVLARVVDDAKLSREILDAAAEAVLKEH